MDPALLLLVAGLFALLALPFVSIGLVISGRAHARAERKLRASETQVDTLNAELRRSRPRKRSEMPPGTIPVEMALAVHEEWRKAGYHMLGDTRVVLRLLSIAHRVMAEFRPSSLAPAMFNDGDRCPPAMVDCQAGSGCTFPDCECEAIPPPPPANTEAKS